MVDIMIKNVLSVKNVMYLKNIIFRSLDVIAKMKNT